MKLTTAQVYAYARKAGFSGPGAVLMTAIVQAESANKTDSIGDVNLTEPGEKSVGLTQINYRPSRDRGNAVRDPQANLDPLVNLQHAYVISGQGKSFKPWSTFTNGAYAKYLTGAQTAAGQPAAALPTAGSSAGSSVPSSGAVDAQNVGLAGDILGKLVPGSGIITGLFGGLAKDAAGNIIDDVKTQAIKIGVTLTLVLGGVALFVIGAQQTVAPTVDKARATALELAPLAAL